MANAIEKYPIPLMFKKILKDGMSGVLQVDHPRFTKELFFKKAHLVFAKTTLESERLGEVLRSSGKITDRKLEHALEIKQKTGTSRKIGDLLVQISDVTKRDVYEALLLQMNTIAASTFSLTEGEWSFTVKTFDFPGSQNFKVRVHQIIHEGVNQINDFSYYRERFYYRSPVTTFITPSIIKYLTPEELKFQDQLADISNATVEKIIPYLNLPEPGFWKNLILLYILNQLDFVEFTVDEELNKNLEDLNDMYEKVDADQVDYYELFDVEPTADEEEIKNRYVDYSEKYHPDKIKAAPDSTAMKKARAVLAEIDKAYDVLSNEAKRKEHDTGEYRQEAPQAASQADVVKMAKDLYVKANHLHKNKNYLEAVSLLEEAVKKDPSRANYFLLLGLSQSKLSAYKKRAEENLKKAAKMEPWNADPLFALGELYRSEKLLKKAEQYYNKALELNMEHTLAGKAMDDLKKFLPGKKKFSLFGKKE